MQMLLQIVSILYCIDDCSQSFTYLSNLSHENCILLWVKCCLVMNIHIHKSAMLMNDWCHLFTFCLSSWSANDFY